MWTAIAAIIGLLSAVFVWWIKQDDQHKKEIDALKKKAEDAKTNSEITSVFDDINRRMWPAGYLASDLRVGYVRWQGSRG